MGLFAAVPPLLVKLPPYVEDVVVVLKPPPTLLEVVVVLLIGSFLLDNSEDIAPTSLPAGPPRGVVNCEEMEGCVSSGIVYDL